MWGEEKTREYLQRASPARPAPQTGFTEWACGA